MCCLAREAGHPLLRALTSQALGDAGVTNIVELAYSLADLDLGGRPERPQSTSHMHTGVYQLREVLFGGPPCIGDVVHCSDKRDPA